MPKTYPKEDFEKVIENVSNGMALRLACDGVMTHVGFLKGIKKHDLVNQYAQAMTNRADVIFEEILSISDDGTNDTYVNELGVLTTNHDHIQRSRLRVDSRKWMLSKMLPKKYGDKLDLTSDDKQIFAPVLVIKPPQD